MSGRAFRIGAILVVLLAWALRDSDSVPALLAVAALIAFGARAFSPTTGLVAGVLMALGPYFIHGAAGLPPQSLFALLSVLQLWASWRLGRFGRWRDAVAWGVTAGLLALAHPFGIFSAGFAMAYLLARERSRPALARLLVAGAVASPFLLGASFASSPTFEGALEFRNLDQFARFAIGSEFAIVLFVGCAVFGYRDQRTAPRPVRLAFGLSIAVSFGAGIVAWLVQRHQDLFAAQQLTGCAVAALLPVAFCIDGLIRRRAVPGFALLFLVLALQQRDGPHWLKPTSPAKQIAELVQAYERDGDMVLASSRDARIALDHHYGGAVDALGPQTEPRVRDRIRRGGRVWLVAPGSFRFDGRGGSKLAQVLRLLHAEGELAYQWEGIAAEYHQPITVLLFQPRN